MKYIGCAYYPEVWPRERWAIDIKMMAEAGINLVRMGEFAWSKLEPREGVFEFEWLREIVMMMNKAGIKVVLCTPTASPPTWLSVNYPETLPVDENGHPYQLGKRRHYCASSRQYRKLYERITTKLAEEFKDTSNVVAWQIDNEIAIAEIPPCMCKNCILKFQEWLRNKYKTLAALDEAWGNTFWSGNISEWTHVIPPFHRYSCELDWRRFHSFLYGEMIKSQSNILKTANPHWQITTNSWLGLSPNLDLQEIFKPLDTVGYDCYIDYHGSIQAYRATLDMYRNLKPGKPFWIAETGAWNCVSTNKNSIDALRAWAWEFYARGAEAIIYFRWRQSLMGEEDHPAILPWSGEKSAAYEKIKEIITEFRKFENEYGNLPSSQSQAAILFDPVTAMLAECKGSEQYREAIIKADDIMNSLHLNPDVIAIDEDIDLSSYKLIILPQLEYVCSELCKKLYKFVSDGGILLAQGRLSVIDKNGKYLPHTAPCGLNDLFGINIDERSSIKSISKYGPVQYKKFENNDSKRDSVDAEINSKKVLCYDYMECIELRSSCIVHGYFSSGIFAGKPFLTENMFGQGNCFYQAAPVDNDGMCSIIKMAALKADLETINNIPGSITVTKRGNVYIFINTSNAVCEFESPISSAGNIKLKPYEVTILKQA